MNKFSEGEQLALSLFERRKSARAFVSDQISDDQIHEILSLASQAPSGGNMQPWQVNVLKSATIRSLSETIHEAANNKNNKADDDYQFYPLQQLEPYASRIEQSTRDMYESLGLGTRDVAQKREEKLRNFDFFGAPVGLILTIDRRLQKGSWIDMGIFIGYLLHAINALGLECCVQGSFSSYGNIVRAILKLSEDNIVVCGVAIGKADPNAPINNQPRRRMALNEFVNIHP